MHIQHVSSAGALELIRRARERGLPVSGEVTPHHLALCDKDVDAGNPDFKMNPPLRTESDRRALIEAVAEGVVQALATDHAPHRREDKNKGFAAASFGVVGLETAIGVSYDILVRSGLMGVTDWIRRWTEGPAQVLGIPPPTLAPGSVADITLLDLENEWTVRSEEFASRSRNTPFEGRSLVGRAVATWRCGRLTWREGVQIRS
jgi:dihydroorotase